MPLSCASVSEEKHLMSSGDARFSLMKGSLLPLLVKCPSGVEEMLLNVGGDEMSVCGWE